MFRRVCRQSVLKTSFHHKFIATIDSSGFLLIPVLPPLKLIDDRQTPLQFPVVASTGNGTGYQHECSLAVNQVSENIRTPVHSSQAHRFDQPTRRLFFDIGHHPRPTLLPLCDVRLSRFLESNVESMRFRRLGSVSQV